MLVSSFVKDGITYNFSKPVELSKITNSHKKESNVQDSAHEIALNMIRDYDFLIHPNDSTLNELIEKNNNEEFQKELRELISKFSNRENTVSNFDSNKSPDIYYGSVAESMKELAEKPIGSTMVIYSHRKGNLWDSARNAGIKITLKVSQEGLKENAYRVKSVKRIA